MTPPSPLSVEGRAVTNSLSESGWFKSSLSGNGSCVEVLITRGPIGIDSIAVRDSKAPTQGQLVFTPNEWRAFVEGVRLGEFDLPE
jgi:Domain of unknown function (DUF397)